VIVDDLRVGVGVAGHCQLVVVQSCVEEVARLRRHLREVVVACAWPRLKSHASKSAAEPQILPNPIPPHPACSKHYVGPTVYYMAISYAKFYVKCTGDQIICAGFPEKK